MKKNDLENSVSKILNEEETFMLSLILLAHLHEDEKYKDLADLIFLFDNYKGFKQFIKYYEGQTIKVPTTMELKQSLKLLTFFQRVYLDEKDPKQMYTSLELDKLGLSYEYCMEEIASFKQLLKQDGSNTLSKIRKLNKKFNKKREN